jgi:hypothetical protein
LNRHEAWRYKPATISSIFSHSFTMSELLAYGRMAEAHWREHRPRMVRELEAAGRLEAALLEAQERTVDEMRTLMLQLRRDGLSPQQAHDQAWELVREKYILLPPEVPEPE